MVLTPRAEELLAPLAAILGEIERTLASPAPFNPASVDRTMQSPPSKKAKSIWRSLMNDFQVVMAWRSALTNDPAIQ
jgi:hypothetical protein